VVVKRHTTCAHYTDLCVLFNVNHVYDNRPGQLSGAVGHHEGCEVYAGCGASTGQTLAQAPQSMQQLASITYRSAPSLMQPEGHSDSHAPHMMHSSVMM